MKKPPKSPRPDNAILARRKRLRKKAERDANPFVFERRLAERLRQSNRKNARRRVRSKGRA